MSPPAAVPETLDVLVGVLERLGLQYAIGGAIAQNYWGTVRATQDIDVLVSIARLRFQEAADALAHAGFTTRDDGGAVVPVTVERMVAQERDRHLFVIYRELVKVEVFLPFLPLQHSILRRAVAIPIGARTMSVTTAEDLILLKLVFDRDKDRGDVRGILWNQKGKLDLAYIREWAAKMLPDDRIRRLEEWVERYSEQ